EAHDLPVPVVAFQRQLSRHACVDVDNVAGGLAVTRHLLRRGRRRIAAVGWASVPSRAVERRLEGVRMALAEAGLAGTERVEWVPELSEAGGAAGGAALLAAGRPDAILALSDVLALGVLSAVHRAGRRVPEDVAVAGYDDLPFAPYLEPPLTTVRLPYEAMGRAAVSWLIGAVRGRAASRLAERYQPELVVREST
ncbi:MAG TPA: substrate-binding domain-containing protein, partial [Chloroflexota bacterium]|nr:substrate-binding domain-containing protein [Chloroflexota bacterium]